MNPHHDIYLVTGNTDMRKSINGLSLIVSDVLDMDPLSRAWFIFCNRQRDKLKILFWDTNGFWLYYHRLNALTMGNNSTVFFETGNLASIRSTILSLSTKPVVSP